MKTGDIKLRCRTCDCYVEFEDLPEGSEAVGTCHANPPQVIVVPQQVAPNTQDVLSGKGNGAPTTVFSPAAVFPVVRADLHFCANHPDWEKGTSDIEQIH